MQNARSLARTRTLALAAARLDAFELARSLIVLGCAAALIMAGPILPSAPL